ncbi:MAG: PIG-L family deacetylase [Burkholderiaceae bacterium]|nr:PIG-L family deacetylase [Burkholderiaceae bacterium]
MDGKLTVSDIGRACGDVTGIVERLVGAGLVVLAPRNLTVPSGAPRLLVIEPHMDDAALSVGGSLLHRIGRCNISILAVVRESNYTSYIRLRRDYLDIGHITKLRHAESELAARILGADFRCLDWADAPNRLLPGEHWTVDALPEIGRATEAFIHGPIYPDDVVQLAAELEAVVSDVAPDELWVPLAVGDHIDHRLTHEAALLIWPMLRSSRPGLKLCFYEDVPYASEANVGEALTRLKSRGLLLHRICEPIADTYSRKLDAVGTYASQFKRDVIQERIRTSATRAASGENTALCEVRYEVVGPAGEGRCLSSANAALRPNMHASVERFARTNVRASALSVIVLPSGHLGEWPKDLAALRAAFSCTTITILIARNVVWQLAGRGGGVTPVVVQPLPASTAGLILRLAWEVLRHPARPRVWVHWSAVVEGRSFKSTVIRKLLSLGQSIQVRTLVDFTAAIPARAEAMRD